MNQSSLQKYHYLKHYEYFKFFKENHLEPQFLGLKTLTSCKICDKK
jgi:hypothetical protein